MSTKTLKAKKSQQISPKSATSCKSGNTCPQESRGEGSTFNNNLFNKESVMSKEVSLSSNLLNVLNVVFGYNEQDVISKFIDKDEYGNSYTRPSKVFLNYAQIELLLKGNGNNRKVNQGWKTHEENFNNGTYVCSLDPVMLDEEGNVVNGGHRLTAALKSKVSSLEIFLAINVKNEIVLVSDQGKCRTAMAHMKMTFGVDEPMKIWNLCKLSWLYGPTGSNRQTKSLSSILAYYDQNKENLKNFFEFFGGIISPDGFNKRVVHRALFLIYNSSCVQDPEGYIKKFLTGEGASKKTLELRNMVMNNDMRGENRIASAILSDCYFDAHGRELDKPKKIRARFEEGKSPRLVKVA